jgi:uncharacterized protein YbdZ (MbtH family)
MGDHDSEMFDVVENRESGVLSVWPVQAAVLPGWDSVEPDQLDECANIIANRMAEKYDQDFLGSIWYVVTNDSDELAVWPADAGSDLCSPWRRTGFAGELSECLHYVVWKWVEPALRCRNSATP